MKSFIITLIAAMFLLTGACGGSDPLPGPVDCETAATNLYYNGCKFGGWDNIPDYDIDYQAGIACKTFDDICQKEECKDLGQAWLECLNIMTDEDCGMCNDVLREAMDCRYDK